MKFKIGLKEYQKLFDESPVGIFVLDSEGFFIQMNKKFCENTGYSKKDLVKMHILDTYIKSEMDLFSSLRTQLELNKEAEVICSMIRKDKTLFNAQINLKMLNNGWIQGLIYNLPMPEKIMNQLEENEEKFRQITEHIRDVFFLVDLSSGNLLYISPGYELIWQKSVNEILNNPTSWLNLVHPADYDRIKKLYKKINKTGFFEANFRIVRPDRSIRCIHARTYPIYNHKHQLYRVAGIAEDVTEYINLEHERLGYLEKIRLGFHGAIVAMSTALEQRDSYTAGHQNNVGLLSIAIGKELNLNESQLECLEITAQVHDIGKIGIPVEILTKPRKLSGLHFELIKTHAQAGHDILKGINFPWPVAEIVLQHHERLDGSGYPRGLKSNEIMLETKILAVADTVDAMASFRPYRPALGIDAAIKEICKFRGTLYEPKVVDVCEQIFQEKRIDLYSKN